MACIATGMHRDSYEIEYEVSTFSEANFPKITEFVARYNVARTCIDSNSRFYHVIHVCLFCCIEDGICLEMIKFHALDRSQ